MADTNMASRDAARKGAEELDGANSIVIGDQGIPLDDELRSAVREVLRNFAAGRSVSVMPHVDMLTTRQAAERLRVSRPTLVKMLDDGLIPYSQPGVHRRISSEALDQFIDSLPERRRSGLHDLAETFDPDLPDRVVDTR